MVTHGSLQFIAHWCSYGSANADMDARSVHHCFEHDQHVFEPWWWKITRMRLLLQTLWQYGFK